MDTNNVCVFFLGSGLLESNSGDCAKCVQKPRATSTCDHSAQPVTMASQVPATPPPPPTTATTTTAAKSSSSGVGGLRIEAPPPPSPSRHTKRPPVSPIASATAAIKPSPTLSPPPPPPPPASTRSANDIASDNAVRRAESLLAAAKPNEGLNEAVRALKLNCRNLKVRSLETAPCHTHIAVVFVTAFTHTHTTHKQAIVVAARAFAALGDYVRARKLFEQALWKTSDATLASVIKPLLKSTRAADILSWETLC